MQLTYIDASNAHITERDNELLGGPNPHLIVYGYKHGWFLPLPGEETFEELIDQVREQGYSEDMIALLRHCRAAGASLLRLDSDGYEIDGLNQNDW